MQIALSRQAAQDFYEIYQYGYSKFGETQADKYAHKIEDCFTNICANPEIGRLDTRIRPPIRRFEVESHVICYDQINDAIVIARILHKSMDILRHF